MSAPHPTLSRVGHLTAAQRGALWRVLSSHALYLETCAQALRGVLLRAQAPAADIDAAAALILGAPPAYSLPEPWPAPPWPDLIAQYGDATADEALIRGGLAEGVSLLGDADELDYDMKLEGPERDAMLGVPSGAASNDGGEAAPATMSRAEALAWVEAASFDAFTRLSRALMEGPALDTYALRLVEAVAATGHRLNADATAWEAAPSAEALADSARRWRARADLDSAEGRALLEQAVSLLGSARLGALGVEALYDSGLSVDSDGHARALQPAGAS
jgi:hypothetical protein